MQCNHIASLPCNRHPHAVLMCLCMPTPPTTQWGRCRRGRGEGGGGAQGSRRKCLSIPPSSARTPCTILKTKLESCCPANDNASTAFISAGQGNLSQRFSFGLSAACWQAAFTCHVQFFVLCAPAQAAEQKVESTSGSSFYDIIMLRLNVVLHIAICLKPDVVLHITIISSRFAIANYSHHTVDVALHITVDSRLSVLLQRARHWPQRLIRYASELRLLMLRQLRTLKVPTMQAEGWAKLRLICMVFTPLKPSRRWIEGKTPWVSVCSHAVCATLFYWHCMSLRCPSISAG